MFDLAKMEPRKQVGIVVRFLPLCYNRVCEVKEHGRTNCDVELPEPVYRWYVLLKWRGYAIAKVLESTG
jgi:hypothetical protein